MQRTDFWTVGEGKSAVIGENSPETCILPYVKQITSPDPMDEARRSGPVPWDNPEGWDREGDGRGV